MDLSIIKVIWKTKIKYILFDNYNSIIFSVDGRIPTYISIDQIEYNKDLSIDFDDITIFDFDNTTLSNMINFKDVLDKWNFLHDIAEIHGMFFEGDSIKTTKTYKYLFSCCTSVNKLPEKIRIPLFCEKKINLVFKKQSRYLDKLFE